MNILDPNRNDIEALPAQLRAMLNAELAAGNEIAEVSHGFPAPPCGACIKMARGITTAPGEGLKARSWPNWNRCSGFTDEQGHFFLLGPPDAEPVQPGMDEIRERVNAASSPPISVSWDADAEPVKKPIGANSPLRRFEASMAIDYEKWKEGIGYDLEALEEASQEEKRQIENKLLSQSPLDWRDVEALAALDTPGARAALMKAMENGSAEERLAVTRYAPQLIPDTTRVASLVEALKTAVAYGGLTQALDEVLECHPPEVMDALLRGLLEREGEVAVHFAARLFYLHGKADEPFDWNHRPFFLRFHTEDRAERLAVYRELCAILEIEPERKTEEPSPVPAPTPPANTMSKPLIEAPASDSSAKRETLGYVEAYDAVNNDDYAFVAYKETDTSGAWRVRISGKGTAGAVFEPDAMKSQARSAGAQGKPYFVWGWNLTPSAGDPRCVEFRVHVENGRASRIEMFVQARKFDQSADEAKSVSFPWPQE